MRSGNERKAFSSSALDCEVGLGLKMQVQPTSSYSCDGGGGGVSQFFNGSTNHPHIYELGNLQRSLDNAASRPYGGMMPVCGKALFTTSQLQELEKQKMIHKYLLASIPVPPQLLLSTPPSSLSQCNTSSGLDLRYSSNGSDPEPWRCKRTDGKKWRCSRDVAPDQKYCERHAHKNRPRSRKHVEISPHNFTQKPSPLPSSTLPRSTSQFPYDQTRCIEWLMRGGNSDETKQQVMMQKNDNVSVYHPQFGDTAATETTTTTTTTRLFIDAISNKGVSQKKASSLSLSMWEGDDMNEWVNNPISWMNSGGPLGEALCLGNATSNLASPHSHSHSHSHGYSNSNTNTNTNTNSSSEDGSHALNFIG